MCVLNGTIVVPCLILSFYFHVGEVVLSLGQFSLQNLVAYLDLILA